MDAGQGWICVIVRSNYKNGDVPAYEHDIRAIFGADFIDLKTAFAKDKVSDDYYSFIRCQNYEAHSAMLGRCGAIEKVVPSLNAPTYLSTREVDEFLGSVKKTGEETASFSVGDVVLVKAGFLKNLYGVVVAEKRGKFKVFFKFYTRSFSETLSRPRLEYVAEVSSLVSEPRRVRSTRANKVRREADRVRP